MFRVQPQPYRKGLHLFEIMNETDFYVRKSSVRLEVTQDCKWLCVMKVATASVDVVQWLRTHICTQYATYTI